MMAVEIKWLSLFLCVAMAGAQFTAESEQLKCGNRQCIVITQCPGLLGLIVQVKAGDANAKRRLLQNHCGFEGSLPKVCCEGKSPNPRISITKNAITTTQPVTITNPVTMNPVVRRIIPKSVTSKPVVLTVTSVPVTTRVTTIVGSTVPFTTPSNSINTKNNIKERRQDDDRNSDNNHSEDDLEQTKADEPNLPGQQSIPGNADKCGQRTSLGFRITFGETAQNGQFPWMASLVYRRGFSQKQNLCGGTLVTDRHVVTAAHCVDTSRHKLSLVGVWIGDIELNGEGGVEVGISEVISHENFHRDPVALFDIAIIKLSQAVEFTDNVRPICLFSGGNSGVEDAVNEMVVAGWGRTEKERRSGVLKYTFLNQISNSVCQSEYSAKEERLGRLDIREDQLCAKGQGKTDSCGGDSGGPLMAQVDGIWYLAGIVSFGTLKCDSSLPGVYTRISSFEDWLKKNLT